jgi:hypothetical protein
MTRQAKTTEDTHDIIKQRPVLHLDLVNCRHKRCEASSSILKSYFKLILCSCYVLLEFPIILSGAMTLIEESPAKPILDILSLQRFYRRALEPQRNESPWIVDRGPALMKELSSISLRDCRGL